MFVAVAGLEPAPLDSSTSFSTARCSTMLNYTTHRIYISITEAVWTVLPFPAFLSLQLCLIFIVLYVAIVSQPYSALLDSLHTRTQPYTTTYQPYCTHRDLTRRSLLIRNFPYYFRLYLRVDYRLSTPSVFWTLSLLPLCRIHIVNGLPTCRYRLCTYLGVCGRWGIRTPALFSSRPTPLLPSASQPTFLCIRCYAALFILNSLIFPLSTHSRISYSG